MHWRNIGRTAGRPVKPREEGARRLFERLVGLILREMGVRCRAGVVAVPVPVEGAETLSMTYQHDLIVEQDHEIRLLGSVKTSSKDRIDKIFLDKLLYSRSTKTTLPHIAVFLNDVQRKKTRTENRYGINSTFLPGHFKAYTVAINPLDGVDYCDLRPNMQSDVFLARHIASVDQFLTEDIWKFLT